MLPQKEEIPNKLYWVYFVGFCLILALPLLNLPPWFSPPDWGKTIIFRIVLSVLLFIFIFQKLIKKPRIDTDKTDLHGYKKTTDLHGFIADLRGYKLPFYLFLGLLGVYFLATLFSKDIYFSLWGSPYRSGGFVNFAFYIIFALLVFFIVQPKDWQKIWVCSVMIGLLVSAVAVFQQFGYFKEILISVEARPPGTIGGPIFLAIYLLFLFFVSLIFLLKEKTYFKKFFYLFSLSVFLYVIFITLTRAAVLGLIVGLLYFLIFYPKKKSLLRIIGIIVFILGACAIFYANTQKIFPEFIQKNNLLRATTQNLSIKLALTDARISGWKVAEQAFFDRPILGYGPENFSIAFERHYDPSIPQLGLEEGPIVGWWDRAHNFIFDIGVTAGIPALIIYLALFVALFWQLQKLKTAEKNADSNVEGTLIIAHGIQASFIGYLVANFFSFDTFSTYLISFLLIGYSLALIREGDTTESLIHENTRKRTRNDTKSSWRFVFLFVLIGVVLWFIWQYNIKPFKINTQLNIAKFLVGDKKCEQAFIRMDKILEKKSFLDSYLRLKYADYLMQCEQDISTNSLEYGL